MEDVNARSRRKPCSAMDSSDYPGRGIMYKIAICDDDPVVRGQLAGQVASCMQAMGCDCSVEQYADGAFVLDNPAWDIVFLDIQLSPVSRLIRRLGLKRLKVGLLPGKADPEMQHTFYDNLKQISDTTYEFFLQRIQLLDHWRGKLRRIPV